MRGNAPDSEVSTALTVTQSTPAHRAPGALSHATVRSGTRHIVPSRMERQKQGHHREDSGYGRAERYLGDN